MCNIEVARWKTLVCAAEASSYGELLEVEPSSMGPSSNSSIAILMIFRMGFIALLSTGSWCVTSQSKLSEPLSEIESHF